MTYFKQRAVFISDTHLGTRDAQTEYLLVVEKARTGTRVVFIPGNHDEMFRKYVD